MTYLNIGWRSKQITAPDWHCGRASRRDNGWQNWLNKHLTTVTKTRHKHWQPTLVMCRLLNATGTKLEHRKTRPLLRCEPRTQFTVIQPYELCIFMSIDPLYVLIQPHLIMCKFVPRRYWNSKKCTVVVLLHNQRPNSPFKPLLLAQEYVLLISRMQSFTIVILFANLVRYATGT